MIEKILREKLIYSDYQEAMKAIEKYNIEETIDNHFKEQTKSLMEIVATENCELIAKNKELMKKIDEIKSVIDD